LTFKLRLSTDFSIFDGQLSSNMRRLKARVPLRKAKSKVKKLDHATLRRMLYYLKLTRESEMRIENVLYRQGKIVGGVYTGRGQEAIGVASAIQLIEGDWVLPSHRDFSSFLIRGFSLRQVFANWMGRAGARPRQHPAPGRPEPGGDSHHFASGRHPACGLRRRHGVEAAGQS
jgi:TPP-dependent pyruvate/acetoin dehydrogenase alpha subunit